MLGEEVAVVEAAFTMPAVGMGGFVVDAAAVAVVVLVAVALGVGVFTGRGWDIGVS